MIDPLPVLCLLWVGFGAGFFFRPKGEKKEEVRKREPAAMAGVVLQGVGYAIAWWHTTWPVQRNMPEPVRWLGIAFAVAGVALAWSAAHHLGKQWAIQAQLVEGHELITSGPYAYIRNPIYSAMLAMLLAASLVIATPLRLVVALAFFLTGTFMRTRLEERLLRGQFGEAFEAYRKRAGWLWPRLAP